MKKGKILSVVILMTVIGAFTGCADKKNENIDVVSLANQLKDGITFQDEMSELDDELFSMVYFIEESDIVNKKIYLSSGATAEEIAVIEGKDSESADRIEEGLNQRIEDEKANFESYIPEEMKKLEEAVLVKRGNCVILCISDDNKKALEIINQAD